MTENQRKHFYMPRWNHCARANDWRMCDGRLVVDQTANQQRSEMHVMVWSMAGEIAAARCRAITPEDLRHACNALVNKGKTSSKQLKENWRVNQVVALFDLLRDPCLDTWMAYLKPDLARRAGIIAHMQECREDAYWGKIALDRFDTRDWQKLPERELAWLLAREKGWRFGQSKEDPDFDKAAQARRTSLNVPVAEPVEDNDPF